MKASNLQKEQLSWRWRFSSIGYCRRAGGHGQLHKTPNNFVSCKTCKLTWEGDMLKNYLKAWNNCRLIFKGMLEPNKQLEGPGFGGSMMQQVLKKQTRWFSSWMLSTLCSGMSQWPDCHLDEHTPGVNFHYMFVWQIMAGGWHDYPDVSDQDLITRT